MAYRRTEARRAHTAEVRKRFLDAARTLLETRGTEHLTVREIIRRANGSTGNFYFYFRNKDAVVEALIDEEILAVARRIDGAAESARAGNRSLYGVLAAMVYTGIIVGMELIRSGNVLFSPHMRAVSLPRMEKHMVERTARFFSETGVLPDGVEPNLAARLWQGALFFVIERARPEDDPVETALACSRWNLRAIGAPEADISAALKAMKANS